MSLTDVKKQKSQKQDQSRQTSALQQAHLSVAAYRRIRRRLQPTPCLGSRQHSGTGALYLKAENFQRSGSFKYRGALAVLTSLPTDEPVITASSGNHGLALATAAAATGHSVSVVLPVNVAKQKHRQLAQLGTDIILYAEDAGEAELHAQHLARQRGIRYVSPYDDSEVIAGQGTIALELLQQLSGIDAVYVSMGGGGLISGIGAVLKAYSPQTRIIGVSAANSAALAASIDAGKVVTVEHHDTLADGCAGSIAADTITLPLAMQVIDETIVCSESDIGAALRALAWQDNLLVEGAAGLALAGWQRQFADTMHIAAHDTASSSVVILCGGNFDREVIAPVVTS